MYTQIIKEILLTIDFEPQHFREFVTYCREQFNDSPGGLHNVDIFEGEYSRHTPIWWYTSPWFLYSMLNRALHTMEVDLIIILGFYLSDLHQHITQLHSEQYSGQTHSASFIVYCGQGFSEADFDQLVKTKGGLLSFNNFLSTSLDREVSLAFAESNQYHPDLKGILFEITVNTSSSSTAFANVRHVSYYEEEDEILFSMHSIFRIGEMEKIGGNDELWKVELTLTGDHDPQMHAPTEHIREETFSGYKGWYRLGYLLIKLGQFDKAQQVYDIMLTQVPDDQERANIYHMLGMVKDGHAEYEEAITSYEESNKISRKISSLDHPELARSYCNIGGMNLKIAEYAKAVSSYEKALEILKNNLPSNHPHLAGLYNNIDVLYGKMGEYSKAFSSNAKALEIRQKNSSSKSS
jgi:tetratricopeptide (TPR) repeat protein